jgi:hypothetical protein
MTRWRTAGPYSFRDRVPRPTARVGLALLALPAGLTALAMLWLLPSVLLLPTLSLATLAIAGLLALLAWLLELPGRTAQVNLWDVAGAFALVGFAAGMLSQPEQVVQMFGPATAAR